MSEIKRKCVVMERMLIISLLVVVLASCGSNQPKQITEVRNVTPPASAMSGDGMAECPAGTTGPAGMSMVHAAANPFQWELPDGWSEQTPTPIRLANLKVATDPSIECYLTVLTGVAGGVEANVNRWRQQMSQPVLSPEEIEALPHITIMGHDSPYVEIEGDFKGMTGEAQPGYMMLAAICPLEENTVFVKMIGLATAVQAEKERFRAFCASLKEGGNHNDDVVKEGE